MEDQDYIDAATRQLTVQVYKDVDDALDQALNRHGVFDAYTLEKGRLTVSLQDGIYVYMLDNKPIVTVSKPQLEVVGTSYRVYFKIEQYFDVQLEVGKYYVAANGIIVKITTRVSGDVYYGAGMYFNKCGKVGKGVDGGYNLIKEWKE